MTLWHYTCQHGRDKIGRSGLLLPARDLVPAHRRDALPWPSVYVWLTDLDTPDADVLGLTRHLIRCDRTAYRYRVSDATGVVAWTTMARRLRMPWTERDYLEGEPGARPRHWFVSTDPVPVVEAGVRDVLSGPSVL